MTPQELTAWAVGFERRHKLNLAHTCFDEHLHHQFAERACAYADRHIPARYADSIVTDPAVETWLAGTVRQSVAKSATAHQRVVSIHTGPSLLLLGETGTTKTSQCYGAMRALAALGVHAAWVKISAPDLYSRLRPRHGVDSEAEFQAIASAPILIVDDLGLRFDTTPFVEEVNYRIVDHRYERVLPTIFTSNVLAKDLAVILGDRVASRLREMTCRVVFDGPDRRRAA